jgi:hypothetical protein
MIEENLQKELFLDNEDVHKEGRYLRKMCHYIYLIPSGERIRCKRQVYSADHMFCHKHMDYNDKGIITDEICEKYYTRSNY